MQSPGNNVTHTQFLIIVPLLPVKVGYESRVVLRTNGLRVVSRCEFLRIETSMTKLFMNTVTQRMITNAFITQASQITGGFPFHFRERGMPLCGGKKVPHPPCVSFLV